MSRLGNGVGSVYRLSGKRKNPWTARKTVGCKENGQPKYKYIGYYRTKAEAMSALMDYNKTPYSLERESLQYLYDRFIVNYSERITPNSLRIFKISWNHLEPLHEKSVATLSRKELQEFFDTLKASEAVKKKCKTVLKHLYDYAVRYDIIQPERVAILKYIDLTSQIATRKVHRDRFSDEDIKRMEDIDDDMARVLLFLIYTGLRAGEYINLTEDDIDDEMVLHIRKSKTEAGIREVPLSEKAKKLLPVARFVNYDQLAYYFNLWMDKNGFGKRTLHCTRYTTVSLLVSAGVDDRIIKAIVGHKGRDVTSRVYTKITNEDKRNALNKI